MGLSGVEPLTSRLSGVRSNHLSYRPSLDLRGDSGRLTRKMRATDVRPQRLQPRFQDSGVLLDAVLHNRAPVPNVAEMPVSLLHHRVPAVAQLAANGEH